MPSDLLRGGLDRNRQAHQELLSSFRKADQALPEEAVKLLSHIVNAHHIWNHRVFGTEAQCGIWELHSLDGIEALDQENHQVSHRIIDEFPLRDFVQYKNSKGKVFRNRLRDILYHILDHASYHRGQIARIMRENELEPLVLDHAILMREEL